jgi:hypothetical protein
MAEPDPESKVCMLSDLCNVLNSLLSTLLSAACGLTPPPPSPPDPPSHALLLSRSIMCTLYITRLLLYFADPYETLLAACLSHAFLA